ncbi:MAG: pilus assembly PilX family protein [Cellvibrionaceae bacterium]
MNSIRQQQGVALIISLVILLVLTIIGVQSMSTSVLEERMAGNYRDKKMAFEAAESALKAAEAFLSLQTAPPVANSTATNGVYSFGSANVRSYSFWQAIAHQNSMTGLAEGPKYVIEERGELSGGGANASAEIGAISKASGGDTTIYGYRVTARGVGGSANAVVLLQSDYEKSF